jgi:hypothetical protein
MTPDQSLPFPPVPADDNSSQMVPAFIRPALKKARAKYVNAIRRKAKRWLTDEQNSALAAQAAEAVTEREVL